MNNLSNKTALVTGSANNLGRALAINLAKQGARIAVHYYTSQVEAKKTLRKIKKISEGIVVKADVTRENDILSMYRYIDKHLGSVDILINLVGDFIYKNIEKTTFSKFRAVIETSLYSTFLNCKQALPSMKKKEWGRIINFGCSGAENPIIREKTTPYYIAKTGVIMLTKILAAKYSSYGITINTISPGILETSIVKLKTPNGRFAQFSDIINVMNFFLKDESSYINGTNIIVSGGWRPGIT